MLLRYFDRGAAFMFRIITHDATGLPYGEDAKDNEAWLSG